MATYKKNPIRRLAVVAAMSTIVVALPASVRADGALRSGTIVSGVGETPASLYVRGMEGCVGAPTCAAWLQSACDPALAGADPAVHTSVVDVRDFADGTTERSLHFRGMAGINWGHFIVQFWDHTHLGIAGGGWEWCSEVLDSRMSDWDGATSGTYWGDEWTFQIPRDAHWMTITSSPDNTAIKWTLT